MDFRGPILLLFDFIIGGNTQLSEVVISFFVVFIIIFSLFPVHECAHALTAKWLGDNTAERMGRVTLNPFAHIDKFGLLMMCLVSIGYAKPVPVEPRNFKRGIKMQVGMAITAAAGPLSNIIFSYVLMVIFKILLRFNMITSEYVLMFFYYSIILSLFLAVFNLIPIPPLDGSKILFGFLSHKATHFFMRYERYFLIAFFVLIFTRVLSGPLNFLTNYLLIALDFLSGFVGPSVH
ncbi:MAG: site-2 protease family protein [Oscillospiraceae bacterium]|nr:site-2 protease family protein [Oscillospiraceae bacterium]